MASSPRPRPTLPLEILEQIVELHGEADAQQWEGDFSAQTSRRHHSNAILACHMVSKQFRACALRVICRKTFIDLYDTPERLECLQDVIFGESHHLSQLERPLRFIKEIVIFLTNSNRAGSPMHKEVVVPVLKAIADKVPIGNLSLYANPMPRTRIYWLNIELDVLHALEAIIQLPSLVSLYMRDVGGLLRQNFRLNTHLHTLSLLRSNYMRSPRSFAAVLPKLEKLFIHHCRQFPDGLQLPTVRSISAQHLYLSESDASFKVIQRSAKTLTKLTVHDTEVGKYNSPPQFSKALNMSSFPRLEHFTYTYCCRYYRELLPTLEDVASFLDVHRLVPNLRAIMLDLDVQRHEFFCED